MKRYLPTRADFPKTKKEFFQDSVAGISVAVVALPLAIGFGITTGTGASSGITTAIIAGFIAALFGGSRFQVSGPTGAMTVVLVPVVAHYGITSLFIVGAIAGLMVIVMGIIRLGNIINRVPFSVIEGFTLGIALVIMFQQIPFALDTTKADGDRIIPVTVATISRAIENGIDWVSLLIVTLTLAVKFLLPFFLKVLKVRIHVPASFVALLVVTLITMLWHLNLKTIGDIPRSFVSLQAISFESISIPSLLVPAILVALLAAIESLLSARIADGMAHQRGLAKFDPNRELVGQGLASTISSLVGGIPATGAIARTSVNVRAHAHTRFAAMAHSIVLFIIVFILSPLFSKIPIAVIAGVLIGTSIRILNPRTLRELMKTTKNEIVVFVITSITTVAIDLIWGIGVGITAYLILQRATKYFKKRK